jgi:hypothetical protein
MTANKFNTMYTVKKNGVVNLSSNCEDLSIWKKNYMWYNFSVYMGQSLQSPSYIYGNLCAFEKKLKSKRREIKCKIYASID